MSLSKPEDDSRKNQKLAYDKIRVDFSISHCLYIYIAL